MNKHFDKYKMLGLNIAYYRKVKGLSQIELADMVGISRTHISRIEAKNMDSSFSLSVVFDIADVLGIDVVQLFDFSRK